MNARQIIPQRKDGLSLTQEEVDNGEPVHLRGYQETAWMLDLTMIGEGGD